MDSLYYMGKLTKTSNSAKKLIGRIFKDNIFNPYPKRYNSLRSLNTPSNFLDIKLSKMGISTARDCLAELDSSKKLYSNITEIIEYFSKETSLASENSSTITKFELSELKNMAHMLKQAIELMDNVTFSIYDLYRVFESKIFMLTVYRGRGKATNENIYYEKESDRYTLVGDILRAAGAYSEKRDYAEVFKIITVVKELMLNDEIFSTHEEFVNAMKELEINLIIEGVSVDAQE